MTPVAGQEPILLVRSWPAHHHPQAPRAHDQIRRLINGNYDYAGLAAYDTAIIHLDWDITASLEDLQHFAAHARQEPGRCLVGPYRLYPGALNHGSPRDHAGNVYAAFRYGPGMAWRRNITEDDSECDQFGFGMVYLPPGATVAYVAANPGMLMDDIGFSTWWTAKDGPSRVCWHVHPVHMNYPPPEYL